MDNHNPQGVEPQHELDQEGDAQAAPPGSPPQPLAVAPGGPQQQASGDTPPTSNRMLPALKKVLGEANKKLFKEVVSTLYHKQAPEDPTKNQVVVWMPAKFEQPDGSIDTSTTQVALVVRPNQDPRLNHSEERHWRISLRSCRLPPHLVELAARAPERFWIQLEKEGEGGGEGVVLVMRTSGRAKAAALDSTKRGAGQEGSPGPARKRARARHPQPPAAAAATPAAAAAAAPVESPTAATAAAAVKLEEAEGGRGEGGAGEGGSPQKRRRAAAGQLLVQPLGGASKEFVAAVEKANSDAKQTLQALQAARTSGSLNPQGGPAAQQGGGLFAADATEGSGGAGGKDAVVANGQGSAEGQADGGLGAQWRMGAGLPCGSLRVYKKCTPVGLERLRASMTELFVKQHGEVVTGVRRVRQAFNVLFWQQGEWVQRLVDVSVERRPNGDVGIFLLEETLPEGVRAAWKQLLVDLRYEHPPDQEKGTLTISCKGPFMEPNAPIPPILTAPTPIDPPGAPSTPPSPSPKQLLAILTGGPASQHPHADPSKPPPANPPTGPPSKQTLTITGRTDKSPIPWLEDWPIRPGGICAGERPLLVKFQLSGASFDKLISVWVEVRDSSWSCSLQEWDLPVSVVAAWKDKAVAMKVETAGKNRPPVLHIIPKGSGSGTEQASSGSSTGAALTSVHPSALTSVHPSALPSPTSARSGPPTSPPSRPQPARPTFPAAPRPPHHPPPSSRTPQHNPAPRPSLPLRHPQPPPTEPFTHPPPGSFIFRPPPSSTPTQLTPRYDPRPKPQPPRPSPAPPPRGAASGGKPLVQLTYQPIQGTIPPGAPPPSRLGLDPKAPTSLSLPSALPPGNSPRRHPQHQASDPLQTAVPHLPATQPPPAAHQVSMSAPLPQRRPQPPPASLPLRTPTIPMPQRSRPPPHTPSSLGPHRPTLTAHPTKPQPSPQPAYPLLHMQSAARPPARPPSKHTAPTPSANRFPPQPPTLNPSPGPPTITNPRDPRAATPPPNPIPTAPQPPPPASTWPPLPIDPSWRHLVDFLPRALDLLGADAARKRRWWRWLAQRPREAGWWAKLLAFCWRAAAPSGDLDAVRGVFETRDMRLREDPAAALAPAAAAAPPPARHWATASATGVISEALLTLARWRLLDEEEVGWISDAMQLGRVGGAEKEECAGKLRAAWEVGDMEGARWSLLLLVGVGGGAGQDNGGAGKAA